MVTTLFKIVLLGESAVGKSSVVQRFVKDVFSESKESTIGAAFLSHTLLLTPSTLIEEQRGHESPTTPPEEIHIKFEIWDTAGQERYRSLASMYYRNAQAALVVYDVTSEYSLQQAKYWIKELQRQANQSSILIALVGNKVDLVETDCEPPTEESAKQLVDQYGLLWFKASAKSGAGIQSLFTQIALRLPYMEQIQSKSRKRNNSNRQRIQSNTVNLRPTKNQSNVLDNECAC